jgi:sulfate transport system permease protein
MASRLTLRAIALAYLGAVLLVPVAVILYRTLEPGVGEVWASITTPAAISAFWLTVTVTAIAVPLNTSKPSSTCPSPSRRSSSACR